MRVTTLNVNGIRSAHEKGFFRWLRKQDVDFVCLQEIRATPAQIPRALLRPRGYHAYYRPSERAGYSGVAIWSRVEADRVIERMGDRQVDAEGRYLRADYGPLSVVSWYLPSGSASPERQRVKLEVMERFLEHLGELVREGRELIVCGDWNIAHRPIDLKNWRANQKYSGFLPEERAWMDRVLVELRDVVRALYPDDPQYTWWSNRGRAREKDVGWRIDYQIATPSLAARAQESRVYKRRWFSDHAPLTVEYL